MALSPFLRASLPLFILILTIVGCTRVNRSLQVDERVQEASSRLQLTAGGRRLARAIEAHGGLATWYNSGDLQFRWTYHLRDLDPPLTVDTLEVADPWTARTMHEVSEVNIRFGWNGKHTWILPPEAEYSPSPIYWARMPYYLMGMPFVLADPGTVHKLLDESIEFEGRKYDQVQVTYEPDVGHPPDDYYILLIDPETDRVKGVRYIATWPPLIQEESDSPERLLTYEVQNMVNGVLFASSHRVFDLLPDGRIGGEIRDIQVSDLKFLPHEDSRFEVPADARIFR